MCPASVYALSPMNVFELNTPNMSLCICTAPGKAKVLRWLGIIYALEREQRCLFDGIYVNGLVYKATMLVNDSCIEESGLFLRRRIVPTLCCTIPSESQDPIRHKRL